MYTVLKTTYHHPEQCIGLGDDRDECAAMMLKQFKADLVEEEEFSDAEIEGIIDDAVGVSSISADEWLGNGTTYRVIEIWGAP